MLADRVVLKIVGVVSGELSKKFEFRLSTAITKGDIAVFCDFSEYNIPVEYIFKFILDNAMNVMYEGEFRIKIISQQFLQPMDYIPQGWKTICLFNFSEGEVPSIVYKLPLIEEWYQSSEFLYFS